MVKQRRKREDLAETAFRVVGIATGQIERPAEPAPAPPPDPAALSTLMTALSKMGASAGGTARAAKLTTAKRRAIAKKGAAARWSKKV